MVKTTESSAEREVRERERSEPSSHTLVPSSALSFLHFFHYFLALKRAERRGR